MPLTEGPHEGDVRLHYTRPTPCFRRPESGVGASRKRCWRALSIGKSERVKSQRVRTSKDFADEKIACRRYFR